MLIFVIMSNHLIFRYATYIYEDCHTSFTSLAIARSQAFYNVFMKMCIVES